MKRPDIPLRYVYVIKEKSNSICENQCSTYQWKDERRKQIVKITANHIAFIAEQIENAKNEKEVSTSYFSFFSYFSSVFYLDRRRMAFYCFNSRSSFLNYLHLS